MTMRETPQQRTALLSMIAMPTAMHQHISTNHRHFRECRWGPHIVSDGANQLELMLNDVAFLVLVEDTNTSRDYSAT